MSHYTMPQQYPPLNCLLVVLTKSEISKIFFSVKQFFHSRFLAIYAPGWLSIISQRALMEYYMDGGQGRNC